MDAIDKKNCIAEEAFVIQHSGEIPEVALHGSIHYLTEDEEGPRLQLDDNDIIPLKLEVVERYRTILLRDLDPDNRDKGIYRGLARCLANWERLRGFCTRERIDLRGIRQEAAGGLQRFLQRELADVRGGRRTTTVNCAETQLARLAECFGLAPDDLPQGWRELCPLEG